MADKMRVHILAKELDVPSKTIIEKCKAEGVTSVKNHMSTLGPGLHATIREWFSEAGEHTAVETAEKIDLDRVRIKPKRRKKPAGPKKDKVPAARETEEAEEAGVAPAGADLAAASAPAVVAFAEAPSMPSTTEAPAPTSLEIEPATTAPAADAPAAAVEEPESLTSIAVAEAPPSDLQAPESDRALEVAETPPSEAPVMVADLGVKAPVVEAPPSEIAPTTTEVETRTPTDEPGRQDLKEKEEAESMIVPAGPQNVPTKAKLQGPRVVRYEAPDRDLPVTRPGTGRSRRGLHEDFGPGRLAPAPPAGEKPPDKGQGRRRGRLSPRRTTGRTADVGERVAEWGDRDLAERRERLAGATGRRIHRRRAAHAQPGTQPTLVGPKTEATVQEPVHMKEFCSATGLNFMQCFKVLRDQHNLIANVNMTLPTETAELLALHFGIELTVIPSKTRLDALEEEFVDRKRDNLVTRPPVVTMLGHVDHGKTSLLDAIRKTRVVAGEEGGITQHIGAYHIETARHAVTFLDTPGHEAFTAMRARGAQLTDVVVLVIAADDGIMPQTIEAINHAKAAEVPIVVALNKIDLGDENKLKIFGQLAEHGLTPSGQWGGDTDVIPTSALTGQGIDVLVEHLADLSALLELKADPTLSAAGAAIEAETKPGVGAVARVLVQEGTLQVGDFVVCGPAFGKVRALLDDRGRRIRVAGPSLPVEIWGLDDVPTAGDKFFCVESLQRAKEIATETKQTRLEKARIQSRKVRTLEEMVLQKRDAEDVPELNLIIKADVDGSVAALRQALGELPSDEVKLTIRHSGVGAITDSDALLASACQGIVVAFRVEAPVGVRRLAEQGGVDIRSYRVIYNVVDDIKLALEGLLAPEERIESRATAEVRQLFRVSKAGMIAGSYVTDGVLDRNHFAKVVRDGVVVRDRCKIASLRRFKDDVREVRAGLECGIRLEGFDDLHVGDVVESFEIVEVARTL